MDLDFLLRELIGNAVPVAVTLDVVVDVDAGGFPLAITIAFARQRPQRGAVKGIEQRLARAFALAEGPLIKPQQKLGDRFVGLAQ